MDGDLISAGQTGQVDVLGRVNRTRNINGIGQRNGVSTKGKDLESFWIVGTICAISEIADFVACESECWGWRQ